MCSMGKCLVRLHTPLGTNRVKIKGHTDPEKTPPATLIQTPRQAEPLQSPYRGSQTLAFHSAAPVNHGTAIAAIPQGGPTFPVPPTSTHSEHSHHCPLLHFTQLLHVHPLLRILLRRLVKQYRINIEIVVREGG